MSKLDTLFAKAILKKPKNLKSLDQLASREIAKSPGSAKDILHRRELLLKQAEAKMLKTMEKLQEKYAAYKRLEARKLLRADLNKARQLRNNVIDFKFSTPEEALNAKSQIAHLKIKNRYNTASDNDMEDIRQFDKMRLQLADWYKKKIGNPEGKELSKPEISHKLFHKAIKNININ